MLGRILGVGIIAALAACYSPPEPDCGFACGPSGACPADYTCAADHVCHRNGAAAGLTCPGRPDAGIDAPSAAPQVLSLDPEMNATGVQVNQIVRMVVDRDLFGVDDSTFYLGDTDGPVAGTTQYQMFSLMAEIRPNLQLKPSMLYGVAVGPGITSASGAPLTPFMWSFTTGPDTVPPHIAGTDPFDTQTGVSPTASILVRFDEPVFGVDATSFTVSDGTTLVSGTVNQQGINWSWAFMPTIALTSATTYTVSFTSAIHDNYGNALAPTSFTFTTQ
jgi:hypothetical protein